jgi:hypothetical protein
VTGGQGDKEDKEDKEDRGQGDKEDKEDRGQGDRGTGDRGKDKRYGDFYCFPKCTINFARVLNIYRTRFDSRG